jgi:hypothetical protein
VLDKLMESLNDEISHIEQNLTSLLTRIMASSEMKDSL